MRLIDADALERAVILGEDSVCNDCAYEFVSLIDEQPTIEAEPVRYGKWVEMPSYIPMTQTETANFSFFKCSQCGWMRRRVNEYKYCPECGARMEVSE